MPIRFFPPRNFIFGARNYASYDVGEGFQFGTIAAAIVAAQAAGDTKAVITLHESITENVSLPKGMSLIGKLQQGSPAVTLTGSISMAAGSGVSNFVGLTIIGDGTTQTITANAAFTGWFSECIITNSGDFPIVFASAGANCSFFNSIFFSTAATAPVISMVEGNVAFSECGTLFQPTSGVFANISGGSITDGGSSLGGQIITSATGSFTLDYTLCSVVTGPCIDHDGGTSYLRSCMLSASNPGALLGGSGTIYYDVLNQTNNGNEIEATLTLIPLNRNLGKKGIDVASANDVDLSSYGNYSIVTGTTQINGLSSVGWLAGSELTLQFDDAVTVKHNTAASAGYASLILANAADLVTAAGTILNLIFDGTYWREKSRTVI